ncbi:hypothetical protein ABZ484_35100 [Streptomyces sp. NPDC006393]|uniref:hypothetical protein n=1 Tax=Streptomyces sp. NPDC006393 TaxID=3156763 RepID=UPI0033F38EF1
MSTPALRMPLRMRPVRLVPLLIRLAVVATVTESGYLHAKLYVNGYRFVPHIGVMFLLQGAVSFAVAALLLFGDPLILRLAAAGTALGALGGFALSRTTGLWGFTERGFQPHPDAFLSVLSETATLLLLGCLWTYTLLRRRAAGARADTTDSTSPAVGTATT